MRRQAAALAAIVALLIGGALLLRQVLNPPIVTIGLLFGEEPLFGSPLLLSAAQTYVNGHNGADREPRLRLVVASYRHSAMKAARALRERRAQVLLGALLPQLAGKVSEAAETLALPLVSPSEGIGAGGGRPFTFCLRRSLETAVPQVVGLLRRLGVERVAAFSSVDDVRYGQALVEGIERSGGLVVERVLVGADGSFSIAEEDRQRLAPQIALVMAPPEVSYWTCRQVQVLWPEAVLFLFPWSLSGDLTLFDEARDLSFFFLETFDPWSSDVSFACPDSGPISPAAFRQVALAMDLIVEVLASDPSLKGGALRDSLAETFAAREFPLPLKIFLHRPGGTDEAATRP